MDENLDEVFKKLSQLLTQQATTINITINQTKCSNVNNNNNGLPMEYSLGLEDMEPIEGEDVASFNRYEAMWNKLREIVNDTEGMEEAFEVIKLLESKYLPSR